jgi:hypothetical protein
VIAAQHVQPEWPQVRFNPTQILRRDEIPERIVRTSVSRGYQSHRFLQIAGCADEDAATLSRIGPFTVPPDLVD